MRYAFLKHTHKGKSFTDLDLADRIEIVGYGYVRRDQAEITASVQFEFFVTLFMLGDEMRKVVNEIRSFVNKKIIEVRSGKIDTKIGVVTGIKDKEYKVVPIAERARRWSEKYLKLDVVGGDTIKYYYGSVKGAPKYDIFATKIDEKPPDGAMINYNKMIYRTIRRPLEPLIIALGYTWDGLIGGDKITKQRKVF